MLILKKMQAKPEMFKKRRMTETTEQTTNTTSTRADGVAIVYYTDPLCCWSRAMEPQWQLLKQTFSDQLSIRYCMGGLIADWNSYHDTINSVSRPVQMGPLWMEVHHRTGVTLNDKIWMTDPPASSYPACIAVKCAGLQGKHYEEEMLNLLRKTVMEEGKNIAKNAVLLAAAKNMTTPFDREKFAEDLMGEKGMEAFRKDLEEIKQVQVSRFPTVVVSANGKAIMITGYRKFEVLKEGIEKMLLG
ncbi:MAG TPA: DsbA family protein [Flavipsychrobacter sp.]|nr:DsbA family protein [Flavipsychrobacter sp.]